MAVVPASFNAISSADQQRHDEGTDAVPPGKVPQNLARRTGEPTHVAEQVQRRCLPLAFTARRPDPAAGHRVGAGEAKVKISMPGTTSQSGVNRVRPS